MERLSPEDYSTEALAALAQRYSTPSGDTVTLDDIQPLPGDAGFRRYFRFSSRPGILGVFAPPNQEDLVRFLQVARLLKEQGLIVPKVQVAQPKTGLALIEDWGDCLYQDRLTAENAADLYGAAIRSLHRLASVPSAPPWLPRYDRQLLMQEMGLFQSWFIEKLLAIELSAAERQMLEGLQEALCASALAQPRVLVHRDFHCRNLLAIDKDQPGLIDFQDANWGPVTYDLVSLARDCYVRWSTERVDEVVASYADKLVSSGQLSADQHQRFRPWFEAMSAQRHLKVLGIFSRLYLRDSKPRYLADLPLVMRYLLEATGSIPYACEFHDWFLRRVVPAAQVQDWYSDWHCAGDSMQVW